MTPSRISRAIHQAEGNLKNVSIATESIDKKQKGTPEYFHAQFLRPKRQVTQLGHIGLKSAFTTKVIMDDVKEQLRAARQGLLQTTYSNANRKWVSNNGLIIFSK